MAEAPVPRKRAAAKRAPRKPAVLQTAPEEAPKADDAPAKAKAAPPRYKARRAMLFRGVQYQPGDAVPGAETHVRVETLIAHRYIEVA